MNIGEIKVCVLRIEGTNCEEESYLSFKRLGVKAEKVHLKQLIGMDVRLQDKKNLLDYHILMIPGGFSSGDYVRAGAILAARIKSSLKHELIDFVENGYPVLGICNGFQVLVELGLLPAFKSTMCEVAEAVLTTNDSSRFECRPSFLKHVNQGKCVFTSKINKDKIIIAPSAHVEGKFLFPKEKEERSLKELIDNDQIVFRYVNKNGEFAGYPWNPNGSIFNIAGICSPQGNVFGMMPHPERVFHRYTHPAWTRKELNEIGDGRAVFESAIEYVKKTF